MELRYFFLSAFKKLARRVSGASKIPPRTVLNVSPRGIGFAVLVVLLASLSVPPLYAQCQSANLASISVSPGQLVGGSTQFATGMVTISAPWTCNTSGGLARITVSPPGLLPFPDFFEVFIGVGQTTSSFFTVSASVVNQPTTGTITATFPNPLTGLVTSASATVTVLPFVLQMAPISPQTIVGGSTQQATTTLSWNAPFSDPFNSIDIILSTTPPGILSVPSTLGPFGGQTSVPLSFRASGVTQNTLVTLTAILGITFPPRIASATVLVTRTPQLKIGLSLDKSTVEPSPNRLKPNLVTARVTVTDTTGQGKSNVSVALNAKAVDLAVAGHDHAGNAPNVLHNLSSAPTGSFQDVVTRQPTQTCMTESDGTCQVFYTAELVSGRYRIIAALSTDSTVSDSKDLTVQLSGLVPLGQSPAYRLTGSWNGGSNGVTSQHTPNHFGTARLIIGISAATGQYFNAMGGAVLGINDMSLPAGGLFDINNDWSPPHNLHRKGSSV